jgi:hypothetical protein
MSRANAYLAKSQRIASRNSSRSVPVSKLSEVIAHLSVCVASEALSGTFDIFLAEYARIA